MLQLTARQTRFIDEYVVSGNAAAAARAAGYGERSAKVTGSRLLTKVNLKAAIAARKLETAEKFELRREHIIAAIMQAISTARDQGVPSIMIRGWVEIAKLCGFYDPESIKAEKLRTLPDGSENIRFVPTAELMRRISEGGEFRNPDGSSMRVAEIDAFYRGLTDQEIRALADGRARVVTKVEIDVIAEDGSSVTL